MVDLRPLPAFSFSVQAYVDVSEFNCAFAEVSGLDTEREEEEIREGGLNGESLRLPGRVKHRNLVLRRALTGVPHVLYRWARGSIEGDLATPMEPIDLTVSLLEEHRLPIMAWHVIRAWPVKMDVTGFDASKSDVAMESLELAYARIRRLDVSSLMDVLPTP